MSDDGDLVGDLLDEGLPEQNFSRDRTTSYWCRKCGSYLFGAPNAWTQISSRAVLHAGSAYRTGDVAMNLSMGDDEFDGNGKLKGCSLRLLLCKHRPSAAAPNCENKVAIKCTRATRKKRYKDWVFFMYPQITVRRGKQYEEEPFIINGVPSMLRPAPKSAVPAWPTATSKTPPPDPSSTSPNSSPLGSRPTSEGVTAAGGSQNDGSGRASPLPDGHLARSPVITPSSSQKVPIRTGTGIASTHQNGSNAVKSNRTSRAADYSSTRTAGNSRQPSRESRASPPTDLRDIGVDYNDDEDDEDDDGPMIQVRDQNQSRDDVALRLDNQTIQLQRQGLLLDKQNAKISQQGDTIQKLGNTAQKHEKTIQTLVARIDLLESKLRLQDRQATEQISFLRRQFEAANSSRLANPVPKRKSDEMDGLEVYVPDPIILSHDRPTTEIPLGNNANWDDSQEVNAYLKQTVREDDSEDEDYDPDQDTIVVQSASSTQKVGGFLRFGSPSNRLNTAARPLERSPHSKKPSFQPRVASQMSQSTTPYGQARESSASQAIVHGHSGHLVRRGISGGRTKAVPPQLSHASLAAERAYSDTTPTTTPSHFDSNKRQRLESGTGSFRNSTTPSMSGSGGSKGLRDAEGYLLKANGQRDLRSIRGRTLGNHAFMPSNGQRRTVASLEAEGYFSGSAAASPLASTGQPKTQAASPSASLPFTASNTHKMTATSQGSPTLGVTTIASHLAALQGNFHVGQEAEKMQQERIKAALNKDSGKQYSNRHADFMSRLGIVD